MLDGKKSVRATAKKGHYFVKMQTTFENALHDERVLLGFKYIEYKVELAGVKICSVPVFYLFS